MQPCQILYFGASLSMTLFSSVLVPYLSLVHVLRVSEYIQCPSHAWLEHRIC
jgi:hypothetical protein